MMSQCRVGALFVLTAVGFAAPAVHAQTILQNFTGSTINQSGFIPPDTQSAVGASDVVEMVNGVYQVYGKTGSLLPGTQSLDNFWTNAGVAPTNGSFDPRIVYDPSTQRYYASALDTGTQDASGNYNTNDILLAVSNSSDPTAGWKAIKIAATNSTDHFFVDYDMLGYNADGVYVSVNNFGSSADADGAVSSGGSSNAPAAPGESVLVVPKTSLTAQTTTGTTLFYNQSFNNTGFSAHPVVDLDSPAVSPGTEYLLSSYNGNFNGTGYEKISSVTGTAATPTLTTSGGLVTVTAFTDPPAASQPNGDNTIDAGDTRFDGSVVKVNGELWGVQDITVNGHAGLKVVRINASTNALISETTIADSSHDYYYGSVAVNGQGSVVVGYTRSGATEYASSYASVGTYTAGGVTFGSPILLKAGVGNYDIEYGAGRNRWGDYSATMVDPTDPTKFWTTQEWSSGISSGTTPDYGAWSTQITEISVPAPEPSQWVGLSIGALGLFGLSLRARKRRTSVS